MIFERELPTRIEVDGGVGPETAHDLALSGADIFVAGAAVFGTKDYKKAISQIREAIRL